MFLKEAIDIGKKQSSVARNRRMRKRKFSGTASVSGIILVFKDQMLKLGYGDHPMLTKQDVNMVNGFIRICRGNSYSDAEIYHVVESVVDNWVFLKSKKLKTKNGKEWCVADRPSIRDFLICRDSILYEISLLKEKQAKPEISHQIESTPVIHGPTQEELDKEYAEMYGDMV